eukprot:gene12794-15013_t
MFAEHGEIVSYKLVANHKTGGTSHMGYGFVKFAQPSAASSAIQAINDTTLDSATDSKPIKVSYATATSSQSTHANLYINRLEPHVTKDDLYSAFSKFGTVVDTKVLTDPATGASRCVGFVHYNNRRSALSALSAMNGTTISCQSNPIYVKFADKKEETKKSGGGGGGGNKGRGQNGGNRSQNGGGRGGYGDHHGGGGGNRGNNNQNQNNQYQNNQNNGGDGGYNMMMANNMGGYNNNGPAYMGQHGGGPNMPLGTAYNMGGYPGPMGNVFRTTGNNMQRYDPIDCSFAVTDDGWHDA